MDLTEISDKDTEDTLRRAANAYFEYLKRDKHVSSAGPSSAQEHPVVKKAKLDFSSVTRSLNLLCPSEIHQLSPSKFCPEDESPKPSSREEPDQQTDNDTGNNSPSSGTNNGNDHQQSNPHRSPTFMEQVLNAVGHPDVLKQVTLRFLNNVKSN